MMKKLKLTPWNKLTLGEKILKVIITVVKWAAIIVIGLTVAGAVAAIAVGVLGAFAIAGAIAGGFDDASRAYRSGDVYVRFR